MVLLRPLVNCIARNLRCYSKTYYEILEVNRTATTKEIKDSFVKLSKTMHPDMHPNDPLSHSKFVELNEAYKVLSKLKSRQMYDSELNQHFRHPRPGQPPYWQDDFMKEFYDQFKQKQYEDQRFYGRGRGWGQTEQPIPEVRNSIKHDTTRSQRNLLLWLASACFTFVLIGAVYQIYAPIRPHSLLDDKTINEILTFFIK